MQLRRVKCFSLQHPNYDSLFLKTVAITSSENQIAQNWQFHLKFKEKIFGLKNLMINNVPKNLKYPQGPQGDIMRKRYWFCIYLSNPAGVK